MWKDLWNLCCLCACKISQPSSYSFLASWMFWCCCPPQNGSNESRLSWMHIKTTFKSCKWAVFVQRHTKHTPETRELLFLFAFIIRQTQSRFSMMLSDRPNHQKNQRNVCRLDMFNRFSPTHQSSDPSQHCFCSVYQPNTVNNNGKERTSPESRLYLFTSLSCHKFEWNKWACWVFWTNSHEVVSDAAE